LENFREGESVRRREEWKEREGDNVKLGELRL